jgi:3',5'-cyclic AMP phosphodiesterase CpdA
MGHMIRCAHLSDLHFFNLSLNPLQFFSKRGLGNLNFIALRKPKFYLPQLDTLIAQYVNLNVDCVIVSGDLSTTSFIKEFRQAEHLFDRFREAGMKVFTLPGNHDQYTKRSFKKQLFYDIFPSSFSPACAYNLKDHKVTSVELGKGWSLILLDTAIATPWASSQGLFSVEAEKNLDALLSSMPAHQKVILANHFPLFEHEAERRVLQRASALRDVVRRHPMIKVYLHGHTHRQSLAALQGNGYPLILDSGSASQKHAGSWNLLDLSETGYAVKAFRLQSQTWNVARSYEHTLV